MTSNDAVPPGAPISPDGQYWWDGQQWVPVAYQPRLMAEPEAVPGPSGEALSGYAAPQFGDGVQHTGAPFGDDPQHTGAQFGGDEDYTATPPKTAQGNPVVVLVAVFIAVGLLAVLFFVRAGGGDDDPSAARATTKPTATAARRTAAKTATPAAAAKAQAQRNIKLVKSTLRNAALAQETYATEHNAYTRRLADLTKSGLTVPPGVTVKIISASRVRYCVSASVGGKQVHYLDSDHGEPVTRACR